MMNKPILITIFSLCYLLGYGQDPNLPEERGLIVTANEKKIKGVRLWKITESRVEYELNGSLHDILLEQIKVIKLDDEFVTFSAQGNIEIHPYDVIISGTDTIVCIISRTTVGNIYFYKQNGYQKADYISQRLIDFIYIHPDTIIFHDFRHRYVDYDTSGTREILTEEKVEEDIIVKEEFEYVDYSVDQELKPPTAGRVIGQVLVGAVFGAVAAAQGAGIGALVGIIISSTGNAALIGAGLVGAVALGFGTGLGVSLVGKKKNVKGNFRKSVGGAYLGLLGSVAIAVITGGSGIGLVLAAVSPAIASTITFTKNRRITKAGIASVFTQKKMKNPVSL